MPGFYRKGSVAERCGQDLPPFPPPGQYEERDSKPFLSNTAWKRVRSEGMIRQILAVLLGVVTAFALVALVEWIGHAVYPMPEGLDVNDPAAMARYVQTLPAGAFVFVLVGWGVGTLAGGLIACAIMKEKPLLHASIVGLAVLVAALINLFTIPHPVWFTIAGIGIILLSAVLAAALSTRH